MTGDKVNIKQAHIMKTRNDFDPSKLFAPAVKQYESRVLGGRSLESIMDERNKLAGLPERMKVTMIIILFLGISAILAVPCVLRSCLGYEIPTGIKSGVAILSASVSTVFILLMIIKVTGIIGRLYDLDSQLDQFKSAVLNVSSDGTRHEIDAKSLDPETIKANLDRLSSDFLLAKARLGKYLSADDGFDFVETAKRLNHLENLLFRLQDTIASAKDFGGIAAVNASLTGVREKTCS